LEDLKSPANLPSTGWNADASGTTKRSASGALPRPFTASSGTTATPSEAGERPAGVPDKRSPRRILLGAAALVFVVALVTVGFLIGRKTDAEKTQAASPTTTASAAAAAPTSTDPAAAPAPLDGTYRLVIQRTKQTYNFTPDPQPPDVTTWWAFRSSCTPSACSAAGLQLDDSDHSRAKSPGGAPVVLDFHDGRWLARAETGSFPCIGQSGTSAQHTTSQVLSLRPQPGGDLVGDMTVTVQTNECGQQGAVVRAPAVATRTGDVAPDVIVPDPVTIPDTSASPTTATSGPHR
jgi:serine/threonine-protein kinase